ncbi:damage-control phosphatase ARMT1 family protein [Planotetraspora mira]|nr:damage-control phosphatase ARMT1 family protein [Planotetraspora mira]
MDDRTPAPSGDAERTRQGAAVNAPPILGNVPGAYALGVFRDRHPALVRQVRDALPYSPDRLEALDRLLEEAIADKMQPLDASAHDFATWLTWGRAYLRGRWTDAPFLWAESFFYRRLLEATGYFAEGPWRGVDPFEPFKQAELTGSIVDEELASMDRVAALPQREKETALLLASLWGNRADLTFQITGELGEDKAADLVVDDGELLWSLVHDGPPGTICVVADNAGRELLPDLALIDHLLARRLATEVVLHVKPQPYFVSDATPADVLAGLRRLSGAPGEAGKAGVRLRQALRSGRLVLRTHPFACAPLPYSDMPDSLRDDFAAASLTITKGDLNYRRLVGDRVWPSDTPFEGVTAYFPGPVVALRTLKSDVLVGVAQEVSAGLDATGERWRTTGTRALIQGRA